MDQLTNRENETLTVLASIWEQKEAKIAELEKELNERKSHLTAIIANFEPFQKYFDKLKDLDWPARNHPDSKILHLDDVHVTREQAEKLLLVLAAGKPQIEIFAMLTMAVNIKWAFGTVIKEFETMRDRLKANQNISKSHADIDWWINLFINALHDFANGTETAANLAVKATSESGEPHVEPAETV